MNTSDPTHNRGKVRIINSFATNQEQMETVTKPSKGGKVKSSQARIQAHPSTSTQGSTGRLQVRRTACGGADHLRKDCHEDVFCTRCRTRSHATEMCCVPTQTSMSNTICIYCGSTTYQPGVTTDLMTTERNQGQHLGTSGNADQVKFTIGLDNHR